MNKEEIIFGGGCFWCTEAAFVILPGVLKVTSGYSGGDLNSPSYEQVSTGTTGHAEVIKIEYDSEALSFQTLLELFFKAHKAITLNRQGNDVGAQYRSIIFYTNENQKKESENYITKLKQQGQNITTELKPFKKFWYAEGYHQDYYKKHPNAPYSQAVIKPKIDKVKEYLNGIEENK